MSKVFILGAAGFIGNRVGRALSAEGYEVYGLIRSKEKEPELIKAESNFYFNFLIL